MRKQSLAEKHYNLALYGKYRLLRWDDLGIDLGTRLNVLTLSEQRSSTFEPRINFTYRVFPWLALKGAWGIYTQDLITLTNENEVISLFEPWVITPNYLKPLEAIHYVAGLEYDAINNFTFSVEGYYKVLHNTAEQNDLKTLSSDPDFIQGSSEAYGSEYLARYISPSIQATASYSLSWIYKNINDWISYPKYDIRHSVTFNFNYTWGDDWQSSISWFYNSGLPFTHIVGYYDKLYLGNLFNLGGLYGNYVPFTLLGDRNIGRLPTYHRLDLSLSKKFSVSFSDITS